MAIDLAIAWRLRAGERREGWQEVERCCYFAARGACWNFSGPPHHARLAHSAFIRRSFSAAKWSGRTACLATREPWAVVRCENHQRVLIELQLMQRIEHLADTPIEFLDCIAERASLALALKLGRRLERC